MNSCSLKRSGNYNKLLREFIMYRVRMSELFYCEVFFQEDVDRFFVREGPTEFLFDKIK